MDMGIKGRRAIVCAASKGLGRGCAEALAAEGVDLVITARTESELRQTADEIALPHIGRRHIGRCPQHISGRSQFTSTIG